MPDITLKNTNGRLIAVNDSGNEVPLPSGELSPDGINNITLVDGADKLPDAAGGTRTLEDQTAYWFNGFVTSTTPIELGTQTPLIGSHGATDGFIYTGASGAALRGTNAGLFIANLTVSAPGAEALDVSGDTSTEMLVESANFGDPAGFGNFTSLGTIDGFRVPSFKGTNFEDFDAGLTFTGTSDKIFFSESPFRAVTASGVTILEFDAACDTDIVDITDCYVKGVQADTDVIRVDASATIADIFQYRGVTHDTTVTKSNILTGAASVQQVGYRVEGSYPLSDSAVIGELALDTPTETTISTQDTYTAVTGPTSLGNETERVTQSSNGVLQYNGKKEVKVQITVSASVEGTSNEEYTVAIAKNGTVEPTSEADLEGTGNSPVNVGPTGVEDLSTGDTISIQVRNNSGTGNITFDKYNINFYGQ